MCRFRRSPRFLFFLFLVKSVQNDPCYLMCDLFGRLRYNGQLRITGSCKLQIVEPDYRKLLQNFSGGSSLLLSGHSRQCRYLRCLCHGPFRHRISTQEQDAQQTINKNSGSNTAINNRPNAAQQNNQNANAMWYFYNPMAVSQGKAAFEKLWGKRENTDNWQRINKTVVAMQQDEQEMSQEQLDSIAHVEAAADSLEQIADSAQNDPHRREYYLAQIPFSKEQVETSNKVIEDGLFNSGVIFKDKLDNLPLAEKQLVRLVSSYTD